MFGPIAIILTLAVVAALALRWLFSDDRRCDRFIDSFDDGPRF